MDPLQFSLFQKQVQGILTPLSNLSSIHQEEEIIKVSVQEVLYYVIILQSWQFPCLQVYKVPPEELKISSLEDSVVTRLVIKDV